MFHVGDVVRKRRKARHLGVEDLAAKAGVGKMTVSAIERGESNYRRETLEKIARALETTVDELHATARRQGVDGNDHDGVDGDGGTAELLRGLDLRDERTRELVRLWPMTSDADREVILRLLRALAVAPPARDAMRPPGE